MTSPAVQRRTRALVAFAGVASITAAVLVAGPGYETSRVHMRSGAIWLASSQTGQVTLVDGATAEVKTRVRVAAPGSALSVVQQGGAAYALNQRTGQLSRVESATEEVSALVSVLPPGDGLAVKPGPDALHAIDVHSGTVVSADLGTLAPKGEPQRLAGAIRPGSVVVDGRNRLWAVDDETGDLVWLAGSERRRASAAVGNGRLAITEDQPAVVDPARGTAELLHAETGAVVRTARAELHADDVVVVTGSADRSRVLVANSTRGELITCTFGTAACTAPVKISGERADLGNPVEIDNHAVIPDYSTGTATVVDLATTRVVSQRELFARPTRFELITHDGIVFFNDPDGGIAGVLDLAGGVRTITKYAEGPLDADAPPTPNHPAQPDQVSKAGHRDQKPGQATPRATGQPVSGKPVPQPPAAGASIAVSPGSRGVVGDKFELTMELHSPAGEWDTQWQLGDTATASGQTIHHSWQQPGVFTVRATATFGTGARVLAETTVTVDLPQAPPRVTALNIRRPKPVVGESVHFSADSTGKPDLWSWTVTRPGSSRPEVTAHTPEFDHAFGAPGVYTVTLAVTKGAHTTSSTRQFTVARGAVRAWGWGTDGQLKVPPSAGSGVVAISAGGEHALALKADGTVVAWGGQHGQSTLPPRATGGVIAISAGTFHNLALTSDGAVVAWGLNDRRQTDVPLAAQQDVIAIAAGAYHSLALKKDGSVLSWGWDNLGEATTPPDALTGVIAIAAGRQKSMALKADGSVVFWGNVWPGTPRVPPEAMSGVVAISSGFYLNLALKADGSVVGWGFNKNRVLPIPAIAQSGVAAISMSTHALALKADGSVIGWGDSTNGASTVPPEYNTGALAIAAGGHFSMVLL